MRKGSKQSPEAKLKMSIAKKGSYVPWNAGMKMSDEYNEKNRIGHTGLVLSEDTKQKMSVAHKGHTMPNRKPFDDGYKQWMSEHRKGKVKPEEWKELMRQLWAIPEYKQKLIDVGKKHWEDIEYKNRQVKLMMAGNGMKPTNPEIELGKLLNQLFPNEFEYVGAGKRIIGGMCPDFIHTNGHKQVIELYGDYWHKGENPQDRIDAFGQHGYQCLIIWEHEMKHLHKVTDRIKEFHK
jgi:G:T-mismatch repair DNA endonuclease (very short patch repair protein)